jgi:predicted nucleic acid-binding protein
VVAAGVAGFKAGVTPTNDSAKLIRDWIENDSFVWLVSADILDEYKAVLGRLRVRPALIGTVVNLLVEPLVRNRVSMRVDMRLERYALSCI